LPGAYGDAHAHAIGDLDSIVSTGFASPQLSRRNVTFADGGVTEFDLSQYREHYQDRNEIDAENVMEA